VGWIWKILDVLPEVVLSDELSIRSFRKHNGKIIRYSRQNFAKRLCKTRDSQHTMGCSSSWKTNAMRIINNQAISLPGKALIVIACTA
jgi:hypothetical protein